MSNWPDQTIRIYYRKLGRHIHCRVFTDGKNGDLVFDEREWPDIFTRLTRIATVTDTDADVIEIDAEPPQ